jgi:hypothetical protein
MPGQRPDRSRFTLYQNNMRPDVKERRSQIHEVVGAERAYMELDRRNAALSDEDKKAGWKWLIQAHSSLGNYRSLKSS